MTHILLSSLSTPLSFRTASPARYTQARLPRPFNSARFPASSVRPGASREAARNKAVPLPAHAHSAYGPKAQGSRRVGYDGLHHHLLHLLALAAVRHGGSHKDHTSRKAATESNFRKQDLETEVHVGFSDAGPWETPL